MNTDPKSAKTERIFDLKSSLSKPKSIVPTTRKKTTVIQNEFLSIKDQLSLNGASDKDLSNNQSNKKTSNDAKPQSVNRKELSRTKSKFKEKFKQAWEDSESNTRLSVVIFVIVLFSVIAAGILYAIEHKKCDWDYAMSLWFVNSLFTAIGNTVGYGTFVPCTSAGKIVSVIFGIIGIPINIVVLTNVGKLLARLLHWIYVKFFITFNRIKQCFKCNKHAQKVDKEIVEYDEFYGPPMSMALVVTLVWFLLSALFFYVTEENLGYGNAFYLVMMSVTTIGLGDLGPYKYNFVVLQFFFIFIGIAFFSMLVNIVEEDLRKLSIKVQSMIHKNQKAADEQGVVLDMTDKKAARHYVVNVMNKQKGGGLLRAVMPKKMENQLVGEYLVNANHRQVATQTDDINYQNVKVQAVASMVNVACETGWSPLPKRRRSRLRNNLRQETEQQLETVNVNFDE